MSGLIRQSIGRRKAYLLQLISSARDLRAGGLPTDASSRVDLDTKINELVVKMQKSIEGLENSDIQWINLVSKLDDPSAEERIYGVTASADDGYLAAIDEANELIGLLQLQIRNMHSSTTTEVVARGVPHNGESTGAAAIRLPKLDIPTYDGDCYEWANFWTVFRAAIHDTKFCGVQKFSYLRSYLRGKALDCISGIELTNENYLIAVSLLVSRFERPPEQLIGGLYSKLKRLSTSSEHVDDMRKTFDTCTKILRQLENAGEDINSNRSLVLDVLSKYPSLVLKELCRRKQVGVHSKLKDVQDALKEYLEQTDVLQELLDDLQPFSSDPDRKGVGKNGNRLAVPFKPQTAPKGTPEQFDSTFNRTSAFTVSDQPQSERFKPSNPCYFCSEPHFNSHCNKFTTLERRQQRLRELGRCTKCLRFNHTSADCRTRKDKLSCFFCRARGDHVSPLCPKKFEMNQQATAIQAQGNDKQQGKKSKTPTGKHIATEACSLSAEEQSVLSTAVAYVVNPVNGKREKARIIFDNGSHRTYVTEQLSSELGLIPNQKDVLTVSVFGTDKSLSVQTNQVRFEIELRAGGTKPVVAHTTSLITKCALSPVNLPRSTLELMHSMRYAVADDFVSVQGPPSILIGSDYFWEFLSSGSRICTDDGIYLIPTSLGLVLGGRYQTQGPIHDEATMLCLTERSNITQHSDLGLIASETRLPTFEPDIDEYWSLETIGILDKPTQCDDDIALKQFEDTVYFKDGRYQVSWPWKSDYVDLPTNYQLSLGRLQSLLKRLKSSPEIMAKYDKLIADQINLGIVEEVREIDHVHPISRIHYLPHHPVVRSDHTTTKTRIVYDASARCRKDQLSLNQCLYRGPVILPDLCSILIRFRIYKWVLTSDIEKAFLQLSLQPEQRDVTRFLWLRDPKKLTVAHNLRFLRFARVPFGIISSPFLLGATIQHHLNQFTTPLAKEIKNNIYVDNVLLGSDDVSGGIAAYKEAKSIFRAAGMNLREWCSNSDHVFESFPSADRVSSRSVSILGLTWDSKSDTLSLKASWDARALCVTKREILRAVATVYDPLGYFQPCTLPAKLFLREIWETNVSWDETLDNNMALRWSSIHTEIRPIFEIRLPRRALLHSLNELANLVVFTDASADAYAAVVYLRTSDNRGGWRSELIFSKSRLAPRSKAKKEITIPRLELLGVTIGVRAANFVRKSLLTAAAIQVFVLTDSTATLGWLASNKIQPKFVENRVTEIRKSEMTEFSYVKSDENPADISTRGLGGNAICTCSLWWHGPQWLRENRSDWPSKCDDKTICGDELTKVVPVPDRELFHTLLIGEENVFYPCGINPTRYAKLSKLLRVTVFCLKFVNRMVWSKTSGEIKHKHQAINTAMERITDTSYVSACELEVGLRLWISYDQMNNYLEVISSIRSLKPSQLVKQLGLILDQHDMLRCRGRLEFAELPQDALQPLLLKRKSPVTNLIIQEYHEKLFHSGVSHTLNELRRKYWIPQGRTAVRNIITRCLVCKRHKGPPFALPDMPAWPRERVARSNPFQFVGLDYFGPIKVSVPTTDVPQKMWACLFTCLAVRAVHIEWVSDCTAQTFVQCISRFIARRGCPVEIISDNAPQFKIAKNLFDRTWLNIFSDNMVRSYIAEKSIIWRFTTEFSPWKGGIYERLIGLMKSTLSTVIGRRLLSWNEFATVITEAEAIINSRPLTYVGADFASGVSLCPADFLCSLPNGTPGVDANFRPTGGDAEKLLIRFWKTKQRRLDVLWKQWHAGYLTSLRERYQLSHKNHRCALKDFPRENEVVLVKNDCPRGAWKLARIKQTFRSSDGSIRTAEIIMPNHQVIRRPINHLYRLEVTDNKSADVSNSSEDEGFDGFSISEVEDAEQRHNSNTTANNASFFASITKARSLLNRDLAQYPMKFSVL